jgi:DNA invertase Pin-like site-specific DNA recombinase
MTGKIIGYIRVSSEDQNESRQLEGIKLDKVFVDKVSGKDINRPSFIAMMDYIREGDTLIVHSMDRLARNLDNLRKIVRELTAKSVKIQFVKENLIFTGEDSPMSNLLLSVMGAFAEFERALIRERQREGVAIAKKKGAYKGRRKALTDEKVEELKTRIANGEPKFLIAKDLNICRTSLYNYEQGCKAGE